MFRRLFIFIVVWIKNFFESPAWEGYCCYYKCEQNKTKVELEKDFPIVTKFFFSREKTIGHFRFERGEDENKIIKKEFYYNCKPRPKFWPFFDRHEYGKKYIVYGEKYQKEPTPETTIYQWSEYDYCTRRYGTRTDCRTSLVYKTDKVKKGFYEYMKENNMKVVTYDELWFYSHGPEDVFVH